METSTFTQDMVDKLRAILDSEQPTIKREFSTTKQDIEIKKFQTLVVNINEFIFIVDKLQDENYDNDISIFDENGVEIGLINLDESVKDIDDLEKVAVYWYCSNVEVEVIEE
jgi:hypothetical protein